MSRPVVMVIDPAAQTAERVGQALAGSPFAMRVAKDTAEAELVLGQVEVAAVVSSLTFPRGNGYDLAKLARQRSPEAAVYLVCGGFDVYNQERAAEAGVTGRIARPFTVEAMRRYLEAALGPLGDVSPLTTAEEALPEVEAAGLELIENSAPGLYGQLSPAPDSQSPVGDERIATFLPRDWRAVPPVKVDPTVVAPAMERAILAILPEVVEVVLNKAIATSPAFREMLEVAIEEAVRQELPAMARKVVRERLAEIELGAKNRRSE